MVVLLFGLLLVLLFLVLIPLVQTEVVLAAKRFPELVGEAMSQDRTPGCEQQFGITVAFDLQSLKSLVTENMDDARDLSLQLLAGVKTGGLIIISVLVNLALIPVVMFYLLRDWKMIGERLDSLVPRDWLAKQQRDRGRHRPRARRIPARTVAGHVRAGDVLHGRA